MRGFFICGKLILLAAVPWYLEGWAVSDQQKKLTAKQELFCREYIIDLNAAQASLRAGYSEKTAGVIGAENLSKPILQARIAELMASRAESIDIDAKYVLNRLIQIDQMDVADILNDDFSMKPLKDWPKSWRTTLSGLDVQSIASGDAEVSIIKKIKWIAENKSLPLQQRDKAAELYRKFFLRLKEDTGIKDPDKLIETIMYQDTKMGNIYVPTGVPLVDAGNWIYNKIFKKGGVLSMQEGGKNPWGDYMAKYGKTATATKETSKSDIRGSLKDANALDWISMGGAAASIIPGLGAIGASVAGIADLANDAMDNGKIDNWGTHAANLGFVGLSAVGLGGLKTAQAAMKASKLARIAGFSSARTARIAKLTVDAEKTGFKTLQGIQDVDKIDSAIVKLSSIKGTTSSYRNAGITAEEFIALKKAKLINATNITQGIKKTLPKEVSKTFKTAKALDQESARAAKAIKPATAPVVAEPGFLAREFPVITGIIKGTSPETLQKVARGAGTVLKGAGLVAGGISAVNAVSGASQYGTAGVNVSDVKNILYTVGGVRGFMKNKQLANKAKGLISKGKEIPGTIQVGTSGPIALKENLTLPKLKTNYPFSGAKSKNEETISSFKEELKKAVGDDAVFAKHFEKLKDFKGLKITEASNSSGRIMSRTKSGLSKKEYDRALAALDGKIGTYGLPTWWKNSYFKEGGVIKLQAGGATATGFKGINFKGIGNILGKANFDNTDFLNLLNFAQTRRSNDKNTALQQQAVASAVTKAPTMPMEYIRTSNTTKPYYDAQAAGVMNVAKRMAKNTSDPSLGASIMYSGVSKAKEASDAGIAAGQQEIQQGQERQQQSNRQTALTNADIDYKNRAVANDAISKMFQLDSNKELADTTATQNLLLSFGQNKQLKDQKLKYQNYYNALTDPERAKKIEEYDKLLKQQEEAKNTWIKDAADKTARETGTWDESSANKDFTKRIEGLSKTIQEMSSNITNLSYALQMPGNVGYRAYAKGGTLAEKKELIRYTSEIKRNNSDVERTFKMILKNNELMQKSLIEIFK